MPPQGEPSRCNRKCQGLDVPMCSYICCSATETLQGCREGGVALGVALEAVSEVEAVAAAEAGLAYE